MTAFDVGRFLDEQRIRRQHIAIMAICTAILIVDGFDIFMVGAIAPAIAAAFHKQPAAMALVFLLQQIGIASGSLVVGPIADRYSRKIVLAVCAAGFGLLMVVSPFSQSLTELAILRGLSGVFLSGVLPTATTIAAEFAPKRVRSTVFSFLLAGYGGGSAGGGLIAAFLINRYGWPSGFWVGGLLPLACLPFLVFALPESIRFRVHRDPKDPAIPKALRRFDPSLALKGDEVFVVKDDAEPRAKASLFGVLAGGRAIPSVLLWALFLTAMGTAALLASWLATFFKQMAGIPIQQFGLVSLFGSVGAVAGNLSVGVFLDRFRPQWAVLAVCFLGYSATIVAMGIVPFGTPAFAFAMAALFYFMNAGTSGSAIVASSFYPTAYRATGLAWGMAAGRIGGIIGPLLGGLALVNHLSLIETLSAVASGPLAVIVLLFLFGRYTSRPDWQAPIADAPLRSSPETAS